MTLPFFDVLGVMIFIAAILVTPFFLIELRRKSSFQRFMKSLGFSQIQDRDELPLKAMEALGIYQSRLLDGEIGNSYTGSYQGQKMQVAKTYIYEDQTDKKKRTCVSIICDKGSLGHPEFIIRRISSFTSEIVTILVGDIEAEGFSQVSGVGSPNFQKKYGLFMKDKDSFDKLPRHLLDIMPSLELPDYLMISDGKMFVSVLGIYEPREDVLDQMLDITLKLSSILR